MSDMRLEDLCRAIVNDERIEVYIKYQGWRETSTESEMLRFYLRHSELVRIKPRAPAISDLSGSGLDCEFSDSEYRLVVIGTLVKTFSSPSEFVYHSDSGANWKQCRLRKSPYVHFWNKQEAPPLPGCEKVRLHYGDRDQSTANVIDSGLSKIAWSGIVGFEVLTYSRWNDDPQGCLSKI